MVEEIKWEWDEEKLEKALEEFKEYLKTKKAKEEIDRRDKKKKLGQKYLANVDTIKDLTIDEFKEILKHIDGIKPLRNKIIKHYENKEVLINLISYNGKDDCPTASYLQVGSASSILTIRDPNKFYIINKVSIEGINKLLKEKILLSDKKEDYPKWRPIFEDLRNRINKIYKKILGREADFIDVDLFLWWLSEKNKKKGDKTMNTDMETESQNTTSETDKNTSESSLISKYFQSEGFYFDDKLITAFYAALKTKGFVILSGLSGTGKTKLAQLFAKLFGSSSYIFLSVRPDWRDGKALLGYYNPLSEEYESTPFLQFILKAKENYEKFKKNAYPYFVILDEMNLSHVEYYFADFLSVLESGRGEDGFTKESIKLHSNDEIKDKIPSEIYLPPNLYIIGTVNVDETTYMFSPKVLDRAFTLEFRDIDLKNYLSKPLRGFSKDQLEQLRNSLLEDLKNKNKDGKARFCGVIADKKEIKEAIIELIADNKEKIKNAINELIPDKEKIESALNKLNELGKLDAVDKEKIEGTINGLDELSKSEVTNKEKIKEAINKLEESINKLKELDQSEVTNKEEIKEALNKLEEFTNKLKELGKLGELKRLNNILQPYDLYFGYRVLDEIALFVKYAMNTPTEVKNLNENEALDFAVLMKVLPKFHGPRQKLEKPLWLVLNWCLEDKSENSKPLSDLKREIWEKLTGKEKEPTVDDNDIASVIEEMPKDKFKYPRTAKKVLMMLRQLYETGFASFS